MRWDIGKIVWASFGLFFFFCYIYDILTCYPLLKKHTWKWVHHLFSEQGPHSEGSPCLSKIGALCPRWAAKTKWIAADLCHSNDQSHLLYFGILYYYIIYITSQEFDGVSSGSKHLLFVAEMSKVKGRELQRFGSSAISTETQATFFNLSGICHRRQGTTKTGGQTTWMSQEVSKRLGSVGYNPNILHL